MWDGKEPADNTLPLQSPTGITSSSPSDTSESKDPKPESNDQEPRAWEDLSENKRSGQSLYNAGKVTRSGRQVRLSTKAQEADISGTPWAAPQAFVVREWC